MASVECSTRSFVVLPWHPNPKAAHLPPRRTGPARVPQANSTPEWQCFHVATIDIRVAFVKETSTRPRAQLVLTTAFDCSLSPCTSQPFRLHHDPCRAETVGKAAREYPTLVASIPPRILHCRYYRAGDTQFAMVPCCDRIISGIRSNSSTGSRQRV
jgi:hypothetical protein